MESNHKLTLRGVTAGLPTSKGLMFDTSRIISDCMYVGTLMGSSTWRNYEVNHRYTRACIGYLHKLARHKYAAVLPDRTPLFSATGQYAELECFIALVEHATKNS